MLNGSMIVEKITNSNGTAIKFEDGTMIYYGKISKNVSPRDNDTIFNLPANFLNNNYIAICSRSAPPYFTEYEIAIRKMETNKITIACFGMDNAPSINITLYVMAIGTWK